MRVITVLTVAAIAAAALASGAGAGQASRFAIHDEYAFELEDFCDAAGLTVTIAGVIDIDGKVMPRGHDGLDYFAQNGRQTETLTANGRSVTSVANVNEKDLHVTDNGDGTVTVLIVATGNAVIYGTDGKAIARNPGQTRIEIVFEDNGTPDDPFDDIELSREIVKGSTGRSDDFCAAVVPALIGGTS
jgi:FlaG/FlaF family flagellin (archaellin)